MERVSVAKLIEGNNRMQFFFHTFFLKKWRKPACRQAGIVALSPHPQSFSTPVEKEVLF
jgi:hypothetical protein